MYSRLLTISLGLAVVMGLVTAVWLPGSTIRVEPASLNTYLELAAPILLLWVLAFPMHRLAQRNRLTAIEAIATRLKLLASALLLFVALTIGIALLSYLASATDRPLMDAELAAIDAAVGFHWPSYAAALNANETVAALLSWSYGSLIPQMLVVPVLLVLFTPSHRVMEFVALYGLSGCITCIVMAAVPAAGAVAFFQTPADTLSSFSSGAGTRHLEQLYALRSMEPFVLTRIEGLVTFPSFHAALGFLFVYAVRGIRFVVWPFLVLNAAMIVATMPEGSHYLADVIGGGAVALLSIVTVRWLTRERRATMIDMEHA